MIADVRTQDELGAVLELPGLTILDVYTQACVICRRIEPMIAAAVRTSGGTVQARKLDAEALPEVAERYEVRGVPTLLLFRAGQPIDRKSGFLTAMELREWIGSEQGT
ncbi:MAG TPA: thioredoxin family protein [Xanthobacteraceae bacterium]